MTEDDIVDPQKDDLIPLSDEMLDDLLTDDGIEGFDSDIEDELEDDGFGGGYRGDADDEEVF